MRIPKPADVRLKVKLIVYHRLSFGAHRRQHRGAVILYSSLGTHRLG